MKKQITVFVFVGAVLVGGGGFLLGANAKTARERNREPYTPTRIEWAQVWLRAEEANGKIQHIDVNYEIEDHLGDDELVCEFIYDSAADKDLLALHMESMNIGIERAIFKFDLDVKVIKRIFNRDDVVQYSRHVDWQRERLEKVKKYDEEQKKYLNKSEG